tara:strand:- start:41 stop:517 length:477 start_codon:yes stop_codon:yes gene_type:complete
MATLTSTITESITLNGAERGSSNVVSISSVTQVFHRIVTCPANQDTTLSTFDAAVDDAAGTAGALDVNDVKYIRVTNLDDTNPVNLSLQIDADENNSAADESATILLGAGKTFVMGTAADAVAVSDANATIVTTLHHLESLLVDPGTNAVTVEVFIAC